MKVRNVDTVLLHLHLDEVFPLFVAKTQGRNTLIGIENAKVIFTSKVEKKTPDEWAASKTLSIGTGGDIDEHANGKTARVKDSSASLIMMDGLGITDSVLRKMASEINMFDSGIGCPRSHLASLLKAIKNNGSCSEQLALRESMKIIGAIYTKLAKNLQPQGDEVSFQAYIEGLIRRQSFFDDNDAKNGVLKLIDAECSCGRNFIFGLKNIYESLWRASAGSPLDRENVEEAILFIIRLLYSDQVLYHLFQRQMKSLSGKDRDNVWFKISVNDGNNQTVIDAAIVETDNPQAHVVLRNLGAVITITKNSHGNVNIQGNKKFARTQWLSDALDHGVTEFCAMNRFGDMAPEARDHVSWTLLQGRGDCPCDNHWHLADKGWLAIFNGTPNHEVLPSKLQIPQLRKNARNAFNQQFVREWKSFMKVPRIEWASKFKPLEGDGLANLGDVLDAKLSS